MPARLVALTGNMGCGKSTVAAMLKEYPGVHVVDCDDVAKSITFNVGHEPTVRTILGLDKNAPLDTKTVADIIFRDREKREKIEALVSPLAWQFVKTQQRKIGERGMLVVESALIFELKWEERFSAVVVIASSPDLARTRLKERGMADADIDARLDAQLPQAKKVECANHTIFTDCDPEALRRRVRILYGFLTAA